MQLAGQRASAEQAEDNKQSAAVGYDSAARLEAARKVIDSAPPEAVEVVFKQWQTNNPKYAKRISDDPRHPVCAGAIAAALAKEAAA